MRALIATEPGSPGRENEDFAVVVPGGLAVIDGAGTPPGIATGCEHAVSWYARTLGGLLAAQLPGPGQSLPDALAAAITATAALHAGTCDLANPDTPSAAVAAVRIAGDRLDYLVLSDCTLLIGRPGREPLALTDNRLAGVQARLGYPGSVPPPGSPGRDAAVRARVRALARYRNQPGGFHVAAASPAAAREAVTGTLPLAEVTAVALLSDGAARLAALFGLVSWPGILAILAGHGPDGLITRTRAAERSDPACQRWPRSKPRDDATAAWWPATRR